MANVPWYTYPRIDAYGSPDPYGGFPKPDSNIQVPDGYPITALLPGSVSGINNPSGGTPAWGNVVTIKLDTPLNALATHTAYLHLAGVAPGLSVGSTIKAGQLIGYSGGALAAGSQKAPVGFALYNGDYYGYGTAWQYNGNPLLNMTPILNAASQGKLGNPSAMTALGNTASLIPGLGTIFTWVQSMNGLWVWMSNPVRIIKLISGILCILVSMIILITPGKTLQDKIGTVKTVAKLAAV